MKQTLRVSMPDGSKWDVPVMAVARNRAESYKDEFGDDVERSLAEDTIPLFTSSPDEISDWAANNMNWSDVESVAKRVELEPQVTDYQEGWINGEKELL